MAGVVTKCHAKSGVYDEIFVIEMLKPTKFSWNILSCLEKSVILQRKKSHSGFTDGTDY